MNIKEFIDVANLWPEPVLLVASTGVIVGCNRRCAALLGDGADAMAGRSLASVARWHGDGATYLQACARSRDYLPGAVELCGAAAPQRWRTEGAVLRPASDGEPALILLRLVPTETADAQFAALNAQVSALAEEVRRRSTAEQRIRTSEERFRQFAEQITGVFWLFDVPFQELVYLSPAVAEIWGRPPEALLGRVETLMATVHPEDRAAVAGACAAQQRGERTSIDYRIQQPHGVWRWVNDRGFPIRDADGVVRRVCGVAVDVTDRKAMEGSLRLRTQRLRLLRNIAAHLLVERAPDAMLCGLFDIFKEHYGVDSSFAFVATDAVGTLRLEGAVGVPESFRQTFARVPAGRGVVGRVAKERRPIILEEIEDWSDPAAGRLQRLGIRAYACFPLLVGQRLFGTLSFGSRSRPRFDDGDVAFFQTVADYVTAAYDRLELVRELEDRDRRKDLFLATLAHELRNPLAPIRSGLELLPMTGDDPEMRQQVFDIMERQLRQMTRLLDDLLDVSRVTRDKLALKREPVALASIVRNAVEISRPSIESAGHTLSISLPDVPVIVDADAVRLAQVFSNLLNNAAKYTDPGGRITVDIVASDDEVTVTVRDTGIGIGADLLPRLFQPFVQGQSAGQRAQVGLGIGLMLARRLVELHGGRISASSAGLGRGAEFAVTLARMTVDDAGTKTDQPAPIAAGQSAGVRVLVVDDNQDFATITARLLRRQGHQVQTTCDGDQAVDLARAFRPRAAFLDIGLPGISGLDLARALRALPETRDMLLVAVSGYGQPEDVRASLSAGFDHHLVKPVGPQEYSRILQQLDDQRVASLANVSEG
jgi:PAS domain S-box-containing protein